MSATPVTSAAQPCPLCGQANQCAITAGLPAESCWCMSAPVSREALSQLAPEARDTVCICPACGSGQFPGAVSATTPTATAAPSAPSAPSASATTEPHKNNPTAAPSDFPLTPSRQRD